MATDFHAYEHPPSNKRLPMRFNSRKGSRRKNRIPLALELLEPRELLSADNETFVARLYQQVLQRPPDATGLAGWAGLLNQTQNRVGVALGIFDSAEHQAQRVQQFYAGLLGRSGNSSEVSAWVGFLAGGGSVQQVEELFLGSPEYAQTRGQGTVSGFLASVYHDVLSR